MSQDLNAFETQASPKLPGQEVISTDEAIKAFEEIANEVLLGDVQEIQQEIADARRQVVPDSMNTIETRSVADPGGNEDENTRRKKVFFTLVQACIPGITEKEAEWCIEHGGEQFLGLIDELLSEGHHSRERVQEIVRTFVEMFLYLRFVILQSITLIGESGDVTSLDKKKLAGMTELHTIYGELQSAREENDMEQYFTLQQDFWRRIQLLRIE